LTRILSERRQIVVVDRINDRITLIGYGGFGVPGPKDRACYEADRGAREERVSPGREEHRRFAK
jgi:hypothetical protein